MLSDEAEVLDLVDDNDHIVGSITHEQAYDHANLKGRYLRASNAFVINSKGQLWIPRRQSHTRIAPNGLDYSMGEHVQAGESYIEGALRGFREELNLNVAAEDLVLFATIRPDSGSGPYFSKNYIYYSNQAPKYNRDDFVGGEWLTPADVVQRIKDGDNAKPGLLLTINLLLRYKTQSTSDQDRN